MTRTVVHFTDATVYGGAERMLLTTVQALDRARWRSVLVYHPGPGIAPMIAGARKLGMETVPVPRPHGRLSASALLTLAWTVQRLRPTVFHAHLNWALACTHGLLAARLARVPAILATQQLFVANDSTLFRAKHMLTSLLPHCYIAVSHSIARVLQAVCLVPRDRIRVVHNAVTLADFVSKRPPENRTKPVVLTLARLDRQKGLPYLLQAAAQVPDTTFLVAGDGPEHAELGVLARRLGIADRVTFLGYREDVADLLAACDVFVLPSLFEGLPVSVIEAMAAGKPVIASAVSGTDEAVVHEATGLLVRPGDPDALAAAIRRVLEDSRLAQRLGETGRARAARMFSAEQFGARVGAIYGELVEGRTDPRRRAHRS